MANISQQKRQKMLDFLNKLKQEHQDDDSLRALGEIETVLNEKKYGLVWEKHTEKVGEMLEHNIPVFCEDDSRKIVADENDGYNFLLEGDNLHSLKLLEKTHKGKIDVIYIDPPYNTGNKDFIYNDSFVDKTDGYSHSKWLSFMSERLEIARELLSNEGVIFISIDDNEQAQLKLLCDEIFGENNFISNICVETSSGLFGVKAKHANKGIVKTKDYVMIYCKSTENLYINPLYTSSKNNFDTHFTVYKDEKVEIPLAEYIKNNDFLLSKFNKVDLSPSISNLSKLMSIFTDVEEFIINISDKIFRLREYTLKITEEMKRSLEVSDIILNDFILRKTVDGEIVQLYPFSRLIKQSDDYNSKKSSCVILGDFWKGFNDDMGNIGKEGNIKFSNGKKPLRLIKNLTKLSISKNSTILDFFAGSYVIIMTVVKSLIKSRVLVLLQNIKTLKNSNLCVV